MLQAVWQVISIFLAAVSSSSNPVYITGHWQTRFSCFPGTVTGCARIIKGVKAKKESMCWYNEGKPERITTQKKMSLAVREGQWPPRRALCRARPRGGPASSPHPCDAHYPAAIRAPAHTPELCDTFQHQSQLRVRNNQPAREGHSCFLFLSSELVPVWQFASPEGEDQMCMWFYIPVQAAVPVIVKNAEVSSWIQANQLAVWLPFRTSLIPSKSFGTIPWRHVRRFEFLQGESFRDSFF